MKNATNRSKSATNRPAGGNPEELTTEDTEDTEDTESTEEKMRFCIKLKSADSSGRVLNQIAIPSVFSVSSAVK